MILPDLPAILVSDLAGLFTSLSIRSVMVLQRQTSGHRTLL